jgi:hypothetical protein
LAGKCSTLSFRRRDLWPLHGIERLRFEAALQAVDPVSCPVTATFTPYF